MAESVIKKLVHQLVLDDNKFSVGMKDAEGKMVSMNRVAGTLAKGIAIVGGAMVAGAAAAAEITRETVVVGDKFDKMSQSVGLSVERLSAYKHVAELSGTSMEGMANGVAKLSKNMFDMSTGTGEAQDAFKRLGIEVTEPSGRLRDVNDVMLEIADQFESMPDGAEKTALSMELMGRSGKALVPMFNAGRKGMEDMLKEGTKLRKWTTAEAKEAALLNDNFTRATTEIKGMKDSIGKQLIPVFQAVIMTVRDWINDNRELIDDGIAKIPEVIKFFLIPAFSAMLQTGNLVITALKVGFQGLQLVVKKFAEWVFRDINAIIQGFAKLGGKIPGVGKILKSMAESSQTAYDALNKSIDNNVVAIDEALDKHKENKEKISALQDSLVTKYQESHNRMQDETKEFNEFVLEDTIETNTELKAEREAREKEEREARERRKQEIEDTEAGLRDRINQLTEDEFDYRRIKLEEEYELKKKSVEDKKLLDEWYELEYDKIHQAEIKAHQAGTSKLALNEIEKTSVKKTYLDNWLKDVETANLAEENIIDLTAGSIKDTLEESANERAAILAKAAAKIVTGHVAEGLTMVGASSFGVWDAIAAVGAYMAKIIAELKIAKTIGEHAGLAGGGWLGRNPYGGLISEGTSPFADNVFLGSGSGIDYYGSKGEFVINAKATEKFFPLLQALNSSVGMANGGALNDAALELAMGAISGTLSEIVSRKAWMTQTGTNWLDLLQREITSPEERKKFITTVLTEIGMYDMLKSEIGMLDESAINILPDMLKFTLDDIRRAVIRTVAVYPEQMKRKGADMVDISMGGPHHFRADMDKNKIIDSMAWNLGLGTIKSAVLGWIKGGDWLQGLGGGAIDGGLYLLSAIPEMLAGNVLAREVIMPALGLQKGGRLQKGFGIGGTLGDIFSGDFKGAAEGIGKGISNFFKDPKGTVSDMWDDFRDWILGFDMEDIFNWIMETLQKLIKGVFRPVAQGLYEAQDWGGMGKLFDDIGSEITSNKFVKYYASRIGWMRGLGMPEEFITPQVPWHDGGVLTKHGMRPLRHDEVPFAGIGTVGEMLLPQEQVGGTTVQIVNNFHGIDRENARSAVRDYIIPELNFYLSSKGAKEL